MSSLNRRDFLKTSMYAGAAFTVAAKLLIKAAIKPAIN